MFFEIACSHIIRTWYFLEGAVPEAGNARIVVPPRVAVDPLSGEDMLAPLKGLDGK